MVKAVSEWNDTLYRTFVRPWLQMTVTDLSAEIFRQSHPLRFQRYIFSDLNPAIRPLKSVADMVRKTRRPVSPENPLVGLEKQMNKAIVDTLNLYRDTGTATRKRSFARSMPEILHQAFLGGATNSAILRRYTASCVPERSRKLLRAEARPKD